MVQRIPSKALYKSRDPKNFQTAMQSDVKLLLSNRAYVSLTTIIMCCLDALAAGSGRATKGKFEKFVDKHFPDLCMALEAVCPGRKGGYILYDEFRNGFAHLRGPKSKFAIAEDHELDGAWANRVDVDGVGQFVAINVDKLAKEFIKILSL